MIHDVEELSPEHVVAYEDVKKLLAKYAGKVPDYQILAMAANLVGQLAAVTDLSDETVAEIITKNMELGATQALNQVVDQYTRDTTEGNA